MLRDGSAAWFPAKYAIWQMHWPTRSLSTKWRSGAIMPITSTALFGQLRLGDHLPAAAFLYTARPAHRRRAGGAGAESGPGGEWSKIGLGSIALMALAVAIIIGFAKQMSLLAYSGLPAYPQGRYLLVLIIPVVWLLLAGLSEIWRLICDQALRLFDKVARGQYAMSGIDTQQACGYGATCLYSSQRIVCSRCPAFLLWITAIDTPVEV